MPSMSEHVDELIASAGDWRSATFSELRRIVHVADPDITEDVKWRRPANPFGSATFEHNGIALAGVLLKGRVRLSFMNGSRLPDPAGLYNAQLEGVSRAIDFYQGEPIDEAALVDLIRAAVAFNLAKPKPAGKK
jgi:hypothetical protein